MNMIILTGRFGMGHVKAAEAIREQILKEKKADKVEIIDFMDYMFPTMSSHIYKGFNFLVSRCSGLYNALNKAAGKSGGVPLKAAVTKKIDRLLEEHQAAAVIVAFPVCSQYISAYKRMRRCDIPLYTFITDITAHEEWIAPGTDKYFVGDISTKNTLLSKGVEEERIVISGIPVRDCFSSEGEQKKEDKKEVLIMGGGLGLIPSSQEFLKKLVQREDIKVTLIAGKNEKLRREIKDKYPQIETIGYTDSVDIYMKRADVIVTKAGGITTFEAMAARTPLYIIKPFLEQEYGNARYIEEHNIGRVVWNEQTDEAEDIIRFLENDDLREVMKANMKTITQSFEKKINFAA
ncbi:MAG: glycosyltransferase [Emergencia sp.]|nr:glycosyltransferase [Emergencia sp.]